MTTISKKSIFRNSISGVAGQVVPSLVSLLTYPYLFSKLGSEKFGIWTLLMVIINYASIGDIGIPSALVKYISEADYRKAENRVERLVSCAIVLNIALGIVIALAVFFLRRVLLTGVLQVPASEMTEAENALTVGCIAFLMLMLARTLMAVLDGFQRMDYSNGAAAIGTIVSGLGMVISVWRGWGLVGLMWAWGAGGLVRCLVSALLIHLSYPLPLLGLRYLDFPSSRLLLGYGLTVQGASVATLLSEPLVKLLLARFLSPAWAGYFELGMRVASVPRYFGFAAQRALFPAASMLNAAGNRIALRRLYSRSLLYTILLAIPAYIVLFVWTDVLVSIWLGSVQESVAFVIRALIPVSLLSLLGGIPWVTAQGIGSPGIPTLSMWIHIILLITITWPLFFILQYSTLAVFLGYFVSMLVATVYLGLAVQKSIGLRPTIRLQYASSMNILGYFILVFGAATLGYLWRDALSRSVFIACGMALSYVAGCYGLALILSLVSPDDKNAVMTVLRHVCRRLVVR